VVLFLSAAALGAAFLYSTNSAQEWRNSANASEEKVASMTRQRDDLKVQVGGLQTQLTDMTTQYNAATDRIRSLSNEKAQVGDKNASLATLVVMSQNVTKKMDSCIKDLQELQTYLVNSASYDTASLVNYGRQINTGCNNARADSDALSKKLAG
jgi:chromosome segregation ATPase